MIRWKALLPTVGITLLIALLSHFFLDGIIERGIEKAGTAMNGAKVELDDVELSFFKLSLTLDRLQVTDENNPMTNALEVGAMNFNLQGKPLSWKKFVVENASITGIRTGTPRKYSGAVAKKEKKRDEGPSKAAQMSQAATAEVLANLKTQYDPQKLSVENLASYKKIQEEKERWPNAWKAMDAKVDGIKVEDNVKAAKAFSERVKNEKFSGPESIAKAKDLLDEGKKIRDDFQSTKKNLDDLKGGVQAQLAEAKNSLQDVYALQKQDVDNALGQIKSAFSVEGITEGLIGPVWTGRIQTWLGYYDKIRRFVPEKKAADTPPPPPTRQGRDIAFPFHYAWPAFHLKRAALSGDTSVLAYKGTLTDVSSEPVLVPPIALELGGKNDKGQALNARGTLDLRGAGMASDVKFNYQGVALAGTKLGDLGAPVTIQDGVGTLSGDLHVKGNQISGTVRFLAQPVTLDHPLPAGASQNKLDVNALLHDVLVQLKTLDVTFVVSDTIGSPNVKIKTNLDDEIKKALNQTVQKEVDAIKAKYQARVQELVGGQKQELENMINQQAGGVTGKLGQKEQILKSAEDEIQKALDDVKKKSASSLPIPGASSEDGKPAVPNLKKLFKK